MLKISFYLLLTLIFIYTDIWIFNHINVWVSIGTLIFAFFTILLINNQKTKQ